MLLMAGLMGVPLAKADVEASRERIVGIVPEHDQGLPRSSFSEGVFNSRGQIQAFYRG